jgi:hypothetical protein
MQPNSTIEPPGSPVPGILPAPVRVHHEAGATPGATPTTARHQGNPARIVLAKLLSVIRGDKYMAGAYPPDWPGSGAASATHAKER